jgi:hypothetical protein
VEWPRDRVHGGSDEVGPNVRGKHEEIRLKAKLKYLCVL